MADNVKIEAIVEWLTEKKADNIKLYDVEKHSGYTDVIIVCEGSADIHNRAIANYLIDNAKGHHLIVISKEGLDNGHWILIDVGDVVVHVFLPHVREQYRIDELFDRVRAGKIEETAGLEESGE